MGLLNPGALIFASLYIILVLLYLWERIRRRVEIPSLLLWQTVADDVVQARKFRPDLLFFLQVLLLAALIAGLARPYLSDGRPITTARRHVYILDTSASMQAREGRTTRFEAARTELRHRLEALPVADEVMLITAAARPETIADFTRDRSTLLRALEDTVPTDTGTELELALAVAAGARQRTDALTDVVVFSDQSASHLSPRWRDEATLVPFGESDANLAITGLQIFQGRFQDARAARANVVVQNFSHREGHGMLTVRLNDTPVTQTGFSIPPRDVRAFLVPSFPGSGRVVAQLDAQIDGDDALAADNVALGWIRPLALTRVLLVSLATPLVDELTTVARATAGLQLTTLTPEAYAAQAKTAGFGNYDVVIFHRVVADTAPATAALYIYPPPDNPLFAIGGDVHGVEVLDWNDQHEAVGALRPLATMPIQHARVILPAEWHEPLLLSRTLEREFPLALAGEQHGHRVACIAFDLEAERLLSSDNVSFLLFFLNLVNWLAPPPVDVTTTTTGSVLPLAGLPSLPTTAVDPHGRHLALGDGTHASLEALTAGEYRISTDGTTRTVYANFFDPVESDIGRGDNEPLVRTAATTSQPEKTARPAAGAEFGWWLVAAGAALLLSEWMVAMRRAERAA